MVPVLHGYCKAGGIEWGSYWKGNRCFLVRVVWCGKKHEMLEIKCFMAQEPFDHLTCFPHLASRHAFIPFCICSDCNRLLSLRCLCSIFGIYHSVTRLFQCVNVNIYLLYLWRVSLEICCSCWWKEVKKHIILLVWHVRSWKRKSIKPDYSTTSITLSRSDVVTMVRVVESPLVKCLYWTHNRSLWSVCKYRKYLVSFIRWDLLILIAQIFFSSQISNVGKSASRVLKKNKAHGKWHLQQSLLVLNNLWKSVNSFHLIREAPRAKTNGCMILNVKRGNQQGLKHPYHQSVRVCVPRLSFRL